MRKLTFSAILASGAALFLSAGAFAVDLSQQKPIEIRVDLGKAGSDEHKFYPDKLNLETGKLYRLVLHNPSNSAHYFFSNDLAAKVWTRKAQVMDEVGPSRKPIAEIKGVTREIEVYPGGTAEWWFVPVAAGNITDVICTIKEKDGKTHAEHGMKASVTIN
ncbi:MAG: biphenyl 2,3-dioxygenase [Alphaproteobacteria bacterium]|nr:biphenyl 2,3-dioxygenase [Alphaproteobacteria bacterium]